MGWPQYVSEIAFCLLAGACGAILGLFRVFLAPVIVVLEDVRLSETFRRSWRLSRYNTWPALVIWLFHSFLYWLLSLALWAAGLISSMWRAVAGGSVGEIVVSETVALLSQPLLWIPFALLYLHFNQDSRQRFGTPSGPSQ